jgi:hypothetical protein
LNIIFDLVADKPVLPCYRTVSYEVETGNLNPMSLSMLLRSDFSSLPQNETALPLLPPLPVRPIRAVRYQYNPEQKGNL